MLAGTPNNQRINPLPIVPMEPSLYTQAHGNQAAAVSSRFNAATIFRCALRSS